MELRYHLWRPGMPDGKRKIDAWMSIELSSLGFRGNDWRDLEGLEIRADAEWHGANEYFGEYGNLNSCEILVLGAEFPNTPRNPKAQSATVHWVGSDFVLKFGKRDGFFFPFELEAWLLPEHEFYRTLPESKIELAAFGGGAPDLRLIGNAGFIGGVVEVPPCENPLPIAARYLREEVSLESMQDPTVEWALRRDHKTGEYVKIPGSSSRVSFRTFPQAVDEVQESDEPDDIPF